MAQQSEFWRSIGSPKYVAAPMVNQSELPFRILCRRYNAQLTFTPMLHGRIFTESQKYREKHLQLAPEDAPVIAQLCGDDANVLTAAAKILKGRVAAVDLNLGCPQQIAHDGHYGAYLLDEPELITGIVRQITQEVGMPVTCKIRKVDKESLQSTIRLCHALEQSGCKALTVHGRHRSERGVNVREADWDAIKIVKAAVGIPVIANGGIETLQDVQRCLEYTKADAVMSSEALLAKPYLFSGKTIDNIDVFQEYLDIVKRYPNQPASCIRAHAFKLLYPYRDDNYTMYEQLNHAQSVEEFEQVIDRLRGALDDDIDYTQDKASWYRRHRNPENDMPKKIQKADYDECVVDGFGGLFGG